MHKQKTVLIIFMFLFCVFSKLFSQISVVPGVGCMPNGLTNGLFSYTGSGNPTNIVWNYGDGSPTTTLTQTQHSYPNVGSYVVSFSAIIGGSPVTYTFQVNVYPQPTGSFNAPVPSNHCTPLSVNFTANSSQSNIVFSWAFGDLGGGSGSTITHAYGSQGSYIPVLTVQNTLTSCFLNVTGTPILASDPPVISITTSNGLNSCAAPFTTAFDASGSTAHSPINGGGLTYSWNLAQFGNFSQATTGNIVFTPTGTYPVILTVTDNNNCASTATQVVKIITPTITAVVPGTVCIDYEVPMHPYFPVTVNSSEPSSLWDMGDGNILVFPIPQVSPLVTPILLPNTPYTSTIHLYSTPGLKHLTITNTSGPCTATTIKTIYVEEILPDFVSTPPSITCSPSMIVSYSNQTTVNSTSSLTYSWNLNNWGSAINAYTSAVVNPTFLVTQNSQSQYANYGHPPYFLHPWLLVTSQPAGCTVTAQHFFDTIQRPAALFEITQGQGEGCVPLSVTFSNTSITSTMFPIVSYTWNVGVPSATLITGNTIPIPNNAYTYTAPGVYYPTLSITTAGGCTETSYPHTITVVSPPVINYTLPTIPICAGHTAVQIQLGSPQNVQHWHVDGDGGFFSGCVNDPNPTWDFSHTGVQSLTISAYQNGCQSTSVIPSALTVKGPIGKFIFETNCTINRKSVKFYYNLEDAVSGTLNFGDGSPPVSITGTPGGTVTGTATHTYATSGDYTATLTTVNGPNLCPADTRTVLVRVRALVADFVFTNSVICKDAFLWLDGLPSVDVFTVNGRGYSWFIDNLPPHQTPTHTYVATDNFSVVGIHSVTLVVKDINGCTDSTHKNFRVSSPAPDFTFNSNPICLSNMPLHLINQTPQSPDPVSNYWWNLGDSTLFYPSKPPSSVLTGTVPNHSPTFTYNTIGGNQSYTFAIVLTAQNYLGCINTNTHVLTVNDPKIYVTTNSYWGCAPELKTFSFTASNTHTNYNIYYGEGASTNNTTFNTNTIYTDTHYYLSAGTYTPSFTVTDFGGCSKTQTLGPIEIQAYPVATFTYVDQASGLENKSEYCNVIKVLVTSTTHSLYSLAYDWNVLGLTGSNLSYSATSTASVSGIYTISMNVKTLPAGCSSSVSTTVRVFLPSIDFKIVPDSSKTTYCLGEPITVSITSHPNVVHYQWDYSDGVVTPIMLPNDFIPATLIGVYNNTEFPASGDRTITATGTSGATLITCNDVKSKIFHIKRVLPGFMRNNELLALDSIHCLGKQEIFKNQSTSNVNSTLNYTWTLGDGATDTNPDVTHTYSVPGTYYVKLHAVEPTFNCMADLTKKMVIFPLPSASITVDSFACPATPFLINGSGSPGVSGILSGTILPGPLNANFVNSNSFTLNTTATVSTTYSLTVTDSNGCQNSSPTASIYIQEAAPHIDWDTTVIIGQPTPLNAFVGAGFSYSWTTPSPYLNCDTCLIYNPVSTTTNNITYSVAVQDGHQCSVVKNTYRIHIEIKVSLDVPTAFTPNGDGINDVIFPNGWGLRKLNYFKIFNRWGQLIFESNDLNVGWDGVYQGVPQNIETYVYQASAETYLDSQPVLTKSGTFKLIR